MTPKRRIAAQNIEIGRERLLDSTQLKIIGTAYEQSPLTFDDATNAAVLVGHLVRQTLEFEDMDEATPLLTTELIAQREKANCYGYTIVASECLDQIGVEHYVGYVNQHAVVMLFDRTSGSKSARFCSMLQPRSFTKKRPRRLVVKTRLTNYGVVSCARLIPCRLVNYYEKSI